MTDDQFDPLFGAEPPEIPLLSAPLVNVLCQVRFTEIVSIQQKSFVASFQEQVRADYPLMQDEQMKSVSFNEHGASVSVGTESIWRFVDPERGWRLSLAPTFLSLETRRYSSRADFIARLAKAIEIAAETVKPTHVTRVGMRYVDRVLLRDGASMEGMLRPEMLGISGASIRDRLNHTVSEALCTVKEGHLLVRWGTLPANGTHDPEIMPPAKEASWFLDLDTFVEYQDTPAAFDSEAIRSSALALATRAYAFFRWAVTDKFLMEFGGKT